MTLAARHLNIENPQDSVFWLLSSIAMTYDSAGHKKLRDLPINLEREVAFTLLDSSEYAVLKDPRDKEENLNVVFKATGALECVSPSGRPMTRPELEFAKLIKERDFQNPIEALTKALKVLDSQREPIGDQMRTVFDLVPKTDGSLPSNRKSGYVSDFQRKT